MPALKFGKFLVVRAESDKTVAEVKRLANSKITVEHKINNRTSDEVIDFFKCLLDAHEILSGEQSQHLSNYKFYEVDENAVSTAYVLADKDYLRTFEISADDYVELKLLVSTLQRMRRGSHFYTAGITANEMLAQSLKKTKVSINQLISSTQSIEAAIADLKCLQDDIRTRMDAIVNRQW